MDAREFMAQTHYWNAICPACNWPKATGSWLCEGCTDAVAAASASQARSLELARSVYLTAADQCIATAASLRRAKEQRK